MTRDISMIAKATATLGLALLAGCTTADCDPTRAELFTGIGCDASGSYAARTTGLHNSLAAAQANELEQQAHANQSAADEANAERSLSRRRETLAILDGRLEALKRQLNAARRRENVDQDALNRAQANLAALEAQRAHISAMRGESDLGALERQTQALDENLRRSGL